MSGKRKDCYRPWCGVEKLCVDCAQGASELPAPAWAADPVIICSQCGKRITSGTVLVGDDIMASPIFCSAECSKAFVPDNLSAAKLESIIGRWRVKPNNDSATAG